MFSAPITRLAVIQKVGEVVALWRHEVMQIQLEHLWHDSSSQKVLRAAYEVLEALFQDFSRLEVVANSSLYVAFDRETGIRGIVLAWMRSDGAWIRRIVVRPSDLSRGAQAHRGTGTLLVQHIAQEVLRNPVCQEKTIGLRAISGAEPFYEKLGFISDERRQFGLKLTEKGLMKLCQRCLPTHVMLTNDEEVV